MKEVETVIPTNLPQEEAFKKTLNYVKKKRYSWILGITSKYEVSKLIPPSRMDVKLYPSWAYTFIGRIGIEVTPSNERSLVKLNFKWFKLDAIIKLLVLGLVVLLSAFNLVFAPIIALLGVPYFFGWLSVIRAKHRLTTGLETELLGGLDYMTERAFLDSVQIPNPCNLKLYAQDFLSQPDVGV